ncbi:hypothetical protein ES703_76441 [subsurface metagenome]
MNFVEREIVNIGKIKLTLKKKTLNVLKILKI